MSIFKDRGKIRLPKIKQKFEGHGMPN